MSPSSIQREVFKIIDQDKNLRFGAKLLGINDSEEKWSGEIPQMMEGEQSQLIGRIITNSEGQEYKITKINETNPEGKTNFHHNHFWIEKV